MGTTPEAIEKDAKEILEKIEKSIENFKEKEQIYLFEREKNKENPYISKQEQKELTKEKRKKELEALVKETVKKNIPKDNYNALTGNQIIVENYASGDKRWIAVSDVKGNNISIKENQTPTLTIALHKEEEKLYAKPIEYYNVSQLNITKEIEQKFVPMKERTVEKAKDKGIERQN